MKLSRAFSLVELLVVLAVIAILAAFLFPVLTSARRKGESTNDLSKLRQIGQAASLYEQSSGEFPVRTVQLVEAGLLPKELCASSLDPHPLGIANVYVREKADAHRRGGMTIEETTFKNSFVGAGEFGWEAKMFASRTEGVAGAGWLLDFTSVNWDTWKLPDLGHGTYRRLLFDGAVVSRQILPIRERQGTTAISLFIDGAPAR